MGTVHTCALFNASYMHRCLVGVVDIGRHMSEALWRMLGVKHHLVDWANAGHVIIMWSMDFWAP